MLELHLTLATCFTVYEALQEYLGFATLNSSDCLLLLDILLKIYISIDVPYGRHDTSTIGGYRLVMEAHSSRTSMNSIIATAQMHMDKSE